MAVCKHCGHDWEYKGECKKGKKITCPSCLYKTPCIDEEESL